MTLPIGIKLLTLKKDTSSSKSRFVEIASVESGKGPNHSFNIPVGGLLQETGSFYIRNKVSKVRVSNLQSQIRYRPVKWGNRNTVSHSLWASVTGLILQTVLKVMKYSFIRWVN